MIDNMSDNKGQKKSKKKYVKPELLRYGTLKELTKFGGSMSCGLLRYAGIVTNELSLQDL